MYRYYVGKVYGRYVTQWNNNYGGLNIIIITAQYTEMYRKTRTTKTNDDDDDDVSV